MLTNRQLCQTEFNKASFVIYNMPAIFPSRFPIFILLYQKITLETCGETKTMVYWVCSSALLWLSAYQLIA